MALKANVIKLSQFFDGKELVFKIFFSFDLNFADFFLTKFDF
jgi:hypothetical protein